MTPSNVSLLVAAPAETPADYIARVARTLAADRQVRCEFCPDLHHAGDACRR